jgi:DNA (cytosine-5)-methyltransferase 1
MKPTIGSLFSGIGGLELGLEMCGMDDVRWQCEIDWYAQMVLRKNFPGVALYSDVRNVNGTACPVDIICGGFPCQDISNAGKRAGITGKRSGLWREFARVVRDVRPEVVFVENVAALASRGLDVVLGDLAELGYDAEWACFLAAEAGAPHRRRRMFIFAYSNRDYVRMLHRGGAGQGRKETVLTGEPCPPWVATDANRERGPQSQGRIEQQWRWTRNGDGWAFESPVSGVAHGVPRRVDRHRCTGNAVVPQCAALAWKTLIERAAQ